MAKREPERTCIACRLKGGKENFIKIVMNKDGEIAIEKDKKLDGRGAYLCKTRECVAKCIKTKALNRVFKTNISQNVYEGIVNECDFE
ncbi:MAG: YlxR family protein [Clostridia bacterium]|nr:YlxR family protein [Clostridia bacterium]